MKLINENDLDEFIRQLLSGDENSFKVCGLIQEGIYYKSSIPKKFWLSPDKAYDGIFNMKYLSKSAMRDIHCQVVSRIAREIKIRDTPTKTLWYALSILGVSKNDPRLSKN